MRASSGRTASTSYTSMPCCLPGARGLRLHAVWGGRCRAHTRHAIRVRASNDEKESITSTPQSTSTQHNDSAPVSSPVRSGPPDPEAAELASMWESIKQDVRKGLAPEEAKVLDSIKVDDLVGDRQDLMRKVADEQLGPILSSLGISEDPLAFFVDLLRIATMLQLLSAGVLYYSVELLGGYDSGDAFRCVCGLAFGYLSRPFIRVDAVLWPLYDWALRLAVPGTEYKVSSGPEDVASALSSMGVVIAVCSLLPQLLWGWDTQTCLQFVLPMSAGWLLFDVAYMAALLTKLAR